MKKLYDVVQEPTGLFKKDAEGRFVEAGVFVCPYCRVVHASRQGAVQCCTKRQCGRCSKLVDTAGWSICDVCQRLEYAERDERQMAKAVLVEDFKGPVYDPVRDEYHEDVGEYLGACDSREEEPEAFVYCCTESTPTLCAETITENLIDNLHVEDPDSVRLVGEDELVAFIDQWNAKQTFRMWDPDFKRKVKAK